MFRDREEAARMLAARLKRWASERTLILAIPRGGVATGAVLARELGAELDVVLARKLRAPDQPEVALGAVGEDGRVYLTPCTAANLEELNDYLRTERDFQMAEIARRRKLFRAGRPAASVRGRLVIVTDDGVATGATMIAALQTVRAQRPRRLIAATPVAAPDRVNELRRWCDEVVCLHAPDEFWAVSQFYTDFPQVSDAEAAQLLQAAVLAPPSPPRSAPVPRERVCDRDTNCADGGLLQGGH